MRSTVAIFLSVIAFIAIICGFIFFFLITDERKIRIVIDGDDMDGFLKVIQILKKNALGVEYNDKRNVIMDVKISSRKLKNTFEMLNEIENIEVMEIR